MSDKILTHWKKLTNPNYIGSYSLQPGEERVVEFIKVVREMVTGADGKKEECTVAYLKDEKPFILNSTNCKTLTKGIMSKCCGEGGKKMAADILFPL